MKSSLGDEEFRDLATLGFGEGAVLVRDRTDLSRVQASLVDRSFMELKEQEVWAPSFGMCGGPPRLEKRFVLKVSRKGYRELQEDPFRLASILIDLGLFKHISVAVWRLSRDQLPMVLACKNEQARKDALRRLNELEGRDDR